MMETQTDRYQRSRSSLRFWPALLVVLYLVMMAMPVALLGGGSFDKVGTTAAQFLKLGVGARALGLGGSFVALADDGTALYWNPAGLTHLSGVNTVFNHNEWVLDITHEFMGLSVPMGRSGVVGFSVTALTMGKKEVTTVREPGGTGLYYSVMDLAAGLSYARKLSVRLSYGLTLKYVRLAAYNEVAQTMALDIGSLLRTDFYGLSIGMALTNFGGDLRYEGRDLIEKADIDDEIIGNYPSDVMLQTEPWPLPLLIRIGVSMNIVGPGQAVLTSSSNRLTVTIDGEHPNDAPEHVNVGVEWSWRESVFLRGGYRLNYDEEALTFGGGVRLSLGALGKTTVNYAVKPLGPFGNTSQMSVEFQF